MATRPLSRRCDYDDGTAQCDSASASSSQRDAQLRGDPMSRRPATARSQSELWTRAQMARSWSACTGSSRRSHALESIYAVPESLLLRARSAASALRADAMRRRHRPELPAVFVVKFTDALAYVPVDQLDAKEVEIGRTREIVKSPTDIEPAIARADRPASGDRRMTGENTLHPLEIADARKAAHRASEVQREVENDLRRGIARRRRGRAALPDGAGEQDPRATRPGRQVAWSTCADCPRGQARGKAEVRARRRRGHPRGGEPASLPTRRRPARPRYIAELEHAP